MALLCTQFDILNLKIDRRLNRIQKFPCYCQRVIKMMRFYKAACRFRLNRDKSNSSNVARCNVAQRGSINAKELPIVPVEICDHTRVTRVIEGYLPQPPANNGTRNNTWLPNNYIAMRRGEAKITLGSYARV